MTLKIYDVAIIGGGFAAMALRALLSESKTALNLTTRRSASMHFSGAFDVVLPLSVNSQAEWHKDLSLAETLQSFVGGHPRHLYSYLLKFRPQLVEMFPVLAESFFSYWGIAKVGDGKNAVIVLGPNGRPKWTAFALPSMAIHPREIASAKRVIYLDLAPLPDHPTGLIQKELAQIFKDVAVVRARPFGEDLPQGISTIWQRFANLALPGFAESLRAQVAGADLIILPPLLAPQNFLSAHRELENLWGTRVVELTGTFPSAGGMRLRELTSVRLEQLGSTWVEAEVQSFKNQNGEILSAQLENQDFIHAKNFVLATGKFVGGGLRHEDRFFEPLLNLPLMQSDGLPLSANAHINSQVTPDVLAHQPFLGVGLWVNPDLQPAAALQRLYSNLWACGHVVGGFDFAREHCGFGVSLLTAAAVNLSFPL